MTLLILKKKVKIIFYIYFILFYTYIENKNLEQPDLSYLQIFKRPSFRDMKMNKKDIQIINNKREKEKSEDKLFQFDNIEPKIKQYARRKSSTASSLNTEYDYPVNIFKKIFFHGLAKFSKTQIPILN